METKNLIALLGFTLVALRLMGTITPIYAAPPIQSEEAVEAETQKQEEEKQEKTPEQKQQEQVEAEQKENLGDIRGRQERDEMSARVRVSSFPSEIPEQGCTAADRARSRLEKVTDSGGLIIAGDILIDSSNEANVEKNEGSINSNVNINITNTSQRRHRSILRP